MNSIRLAQPPFLSVQGEGPRVGRLTIFVRFFGCNLRCAGFFQKDPTKPETYVKPIIAPPSSFKTLQEFPVVEYGCDTLYAIDPKYKHLAEEYDLESLTSAILGLLPKDEQGIPLWTHPITGNEYDICFTGGEPMLQQSKIVEILKELNHLESKPSYIQFETNGTKSISKELIMALVNNKVLFNVSPKLFSVSGEKVGWNEKNLQEIMRLETLYENISVDLKVVVNATQIAFDELISKLKSLHPTCPVYVMPVGSSFEQQSDYAVINKIATAAVENGFHISGRLHCSLFGNDAER